MERKQIKCNLFPGELVESSQRIRGMTFVPISFLASSISHSHLSSFSLSLLILLSAIFFFFIILFWFICCVSFEIFNCYLSSFVSHSYAADSLLPSRVCIFISISFFCYAHHLLCYCFLSIYIVDVFYLFSSSISFLHLFQCLFLLFCPPSSLCCLFFYLHILSLLLAYFLSYR